MKELILSFIIASICVPIFAQDYKKGDMTKTYEWSYEHQYPPTSIDKLKNTVKYKNEEENDWKAVMITRSKYYMYVKDMSLAYYGSAFENFRFHWIRTGTGICRTIDGPETSFYYGQWKQDMEHGEGLYYVRGEKIIYGQWKHGKMVKSKKRDATEEEKKNMMEQIELLETAISLAN